MPTYEYECSECGIVFDLVQPITEAPRRKLKKADPKPCKCNAAVRRRVSAGAGIIFKGSGFYQTDYRSENYKKAAKADKASSEPKSKSDSTKSKTDKPATKTDAAQKPTTAPKKSD